MTTTETALKGIITSAIEESTNLKVKSLNFTRRFDEGNETILVQVYLRRSEKKLPKTILYELIKLTSRAIHEAGATTLPVILPHLAGDQRFA